MPIPGIIAVLGGAAASIGRMAGGGALATAGAGGGAAGAVGGAAGGAAGGGGGFMKMIQGAIGRSEKGQGIFTEGWQDDMKNRESAFNLQKKQARYSKMVGKDAKGMGGGMQKVMKGMAGKAGMLGISASMSSLLRQSQLFTGLMGAIFQVVGAFIDVLLAPFMPGLFKLVALMAKTIPWAQKFSKGVYWLIDKFIVWPIKMYLKLYKLYFSLIIKIWGWIFGMLWKGLQRWIFAPIGKMWDWFKNLDFVQSVVNGVKGAWDTVIGKVSSWWSGPLHPIKSMFGVISGIIGGIWSMGKSVWDWLKELPWTIGEFFISIKNKIVDVWNGITGWLGETFDPVWEVIRTTVDWVGGAFKTAWDGMKEGFTWIGGTFKTGWNSVKMAIDWVGGAFKTGWDSVKTAIDWVGGAFKTGWDSVKTAIDWVGGAFKTGWDSVKTAIDWVGGAFKTGWDSVKTAIDWIGGAFKTGWDSVKAAIDWVGGAFKTAWDGMKAGLKWIGGGFKLAWITLKQWVGDVKGVLVDKVKRIAVWMWTTGKGILEFIMNLMKKLGEYVLGGIDTIMGWVGQVLSWLKDGVNWVKDSIPTLLDTIWRNIKSILGFEWLKKGFNSILDAMMWMAERMGDLGFDKWGVKFKPFEKMKGMSEMLAEWKFAEAPPTQEVNINIKTSVSGSMYGGESLNQQEQYNAKVRTGRDIIASINLGTDVDTVALPPWSNFP